jgi:hypothetical protein
MQTSLVDNFKSCAFCELQRQIDRSFSHCSKLCEELLQWENSRLICKFRIPRKRKKYSFRERGTRSTGKVSEVTNLLFLFVVKSEVFQVRKSKSANYFKFRNISFHKMSLSSRMTPLSPQILLQRIWFVSEFLTCGVLKIRSHVHVGFKRWRAQNIPRAQG